MTQELHNSLIRELEDAEKIEDCTRRFEAIQTVQSHILAALCDCQMKTADRVKTLIRTAEERELKKNAQVNTVGWIAKAGWTIFSAVGFAGIVKIMKVLGEL